AEPSNSRPKMPVSDFMLAPFWGRDVSPDATAGLPALGNREPADCDIRRIKTEPRTAASTVPRLNCPESLSAKKALLGIRNPDRQRRCRSISRPLLLERGLWDCQAAWPEDRPRAPVSGTAIGNFGTVSTSSAPAQTVVAPGLAEAARRRQLRSRVHRNPPMPPRQLAVAAMDREGEYPRDCQIAR